jgi:hypothetical protein
MRKQLSFRIERRGPIIRRRFVDSQSNAETISIRGAGKQRLGFGRPLKYIRGALPAEHRHNLRSNSSREKMLRCQTE